ncbi:DNA binding protein [Salinibius halmophilus]|uniref:DNA binding protein n=1 Tax=Salinibius halmophilus TaxID=1853216 RepID=UPI000E67524B|nr:DNA binding protein [Salinibius halmophilus]
MAENFDALIEQKKKEIEQLVQQKEAELQRQEGLRQLDAKFAGFYSEFSLTEDDYFAFKQKEIEKWIKAQARSESPAAIVDALNAYFSRYDGKKKKAAVSTGPKLKVGKYRNPNTGEVIEKIKRNPKPLDQWIDENGFDTVASWLVD